VNKGLHPTNRMKIEIRPLHEIFPYEKNARKIPQAAIDAVMLSLKTYGWQQPIVVDNQGVIVAGHTRRLAALQLGWHEAPVTVFEGTPEQARQYRLMDNRSHDNATWEPDVLRLEMLELKALDLDLNLTGFNSRELDAMLRPAVSNEDDAPAVPEVAVTQPGDLWTMGEHRLLCGDATDADAVKRVCGEGQADLVFTDPPYGVDYDGGTKVREKLKGDANTDLYAPACLIAAKFSKGGAPFYLWHAGVKGIAAAAAAAGYQIRCELIWNKNQAQFGSLSCQYKQKHEPAYYCFKKGQRAQWYGPKNEVTVWDCDRAKVNEYHPTQKPVALVERALMNSSKGGDAVLDLFGGSGSTLIACEKLERSARLTELDARYCDVIVKRWMNLTGKQAYNQDGVCFPL
jgi:DNA modification methylase